ncbi:hypothetical protein PSN45_002870 [Yamadazyma tenuis]|uniref:uncharacterized protein n=1 Tax=Candida tenuis TaxID=2315449 RepID=UPI00279EC29D|nr:hypothetical protein PSN45_002870 [Yamadazyma tenuis]
MNTTSVAGSWSGTCTSAEDAHERYTEFEITEQDGSWYGKRKNRKDSNAQPFKLEWTGANEFKGDMNHWIITTKIGVIGTFDTDFSRLKLDIFGEGMSGLDDYTVHLKKSKDDMAVYTTPFDASTYKYRAPRPGSLASCDAQDVGILPEALESLVQDLASLKGSIDEVKTPRVEAVNVLKNGKLILEEYFWGMDRNSRHIISSCTKSITAILLCIAVDQKQADLEANLADVLESTSSWGDSPPIKVKHLLSMTTGTSTGFEDALELLLSEDIVKTSLNKRRIKEPGSTYQYDNNLPAVIGCYLEMVTGMSVEDFAEKYLFGPLGISNYRWTYMRPLAPTGKRSVLTAGGLYISMNELTKIGLMMIQNGKFDGTAILSPNMVNICTSQHTAKGDYPYGFYWHLHQNSAHYPGMGGFSALGQGEQIVSVFPDKDLVVVVFSASWHSASTSITETLSPHLRSL